MIDIEHIRNFFPSSIRDNPGFSRFMLKEYIQCQMLEYISHTKYVTQLSFIGGTHLRLIKHVDRFSEDLDFDCKGMERNDFIALTDDVLRYLSLLGYRVEAAEKEHDGLSAFRRSIYFPQLLFTLNLSGYRNARFLVKLEMQDQGIDYNAVPGIVKSCGFFFPIPVPPDDILCSMKISALLNRGKGRDFYDVMFLLAQYEPNYTFLSIRHGIKNKEELKQACRERLKEVDLSLKQKDVMHLLFDPMKSGMISQFGAFVEQL